MLVLSCIVFMNIVFYYLKLGWLFFERKLIFVLYFVVCDNNWMIKLLIFLMWIYLGEIRCMIDNSNFIFKICLRDILRVKI